MTRLPRPEFAERRGYHHGNLREALLSAARELIAERGPAGFSLSDAAKLAGVSPAAPYRHFKDRRALLAEIARQGFVSLGERLGQAARDASEGPEAFFAMGNAYLAFARDEPATYATMFNSGLAGGDEPTAGSSGAEFHGFDMLRQAVMRALDTRDERLAQTGALLVYALTHGLATLSAPGSLAVPGGIGDAQAALKLGVGALLTGLPVLAKRGC